MLKLILDLQNRASNNPVQGIECFILKQDQVDYLFQCCMHNYNTYFDITFTSSNFSRMLCKLFVFYFQG